MGDVRPASQPQSSSQLTLPQSSFQLTLPQSSSQLTLAQIIPPLAPICYVREVSLALNKAEQWLTQGRAVVVGGEWPGRRVGGAVRGVGEW